MAWLGCHMPLCSESVMESGSKKTCRLCCMEIPQEARKCPYCQHFQTRSALLFYHPASGVLLAALPMVVFLIVIARLFDQGEDYQEYKDQILITESQIAFGEFKSGETVGVIGTITNNSAVPWKEILFNVEFTDAAGKRVDVGQKEEYQFHLPPHDSLAFKVSFRREYPVTNYVKHRVRVATAKDARARW